MSKSKYQIVDALRAVIDLVPIGALGLLGGYAQGSYYRSGPWIKERIKLLSNGLEQTSCLQMAAILHLVFGF